MVSTNKTRSTKTCCSSHVEQARRSKRPDGMRYLQTIKSCTRKSAAMVLNSTGVRAVGEEFRASRR